MRVSTRRKKTAGAHWEGDRIVVVVPTHLRGCRPRRHGRPPHPPPGPPPAPPPRLRRPSSGERARQLGRTYLDGVEPASIRWATNQTKRWGSCTLATREIRISSRLRVAPAWVLDAVIVHELAHLLEPGHTARFRELEARYPRRHDADMFLEGYALGMHMDAAGDADAGDGTGARPGRRRAAAPARAGPGIAAAHRAPRSRLQQVPWPSCSRRSPPSPTPSPRSCSASGSSRPRSRPPCRLSLMAHAVKQGHLADRLRPHARAVRPPGHRPQASAS